MTISPTPIGNCFSIKIETYWNVNNHSGSISSILSMIKIETYWNVNMTEADCEKTGLLIKIETYWNVNVYRTTPLGREIALK